MLEIHLLLFLLKEIQVVLQQDLVVVWFLEVVEALPKLDNKALRLVALLDLVEMVQHLQLTEHQQQELVAVEVLEIMVKLQVELVVQEAAVQVVIFH